MNTIHEKPIKNGLKDKSLNDHHSLFHRHINLLFNVSKKSQFWWPTALPPLEQPIQVLIVVLAEPYCCVGLYVLQNPHGCTPRPDSYPTSPSEPAYMPLNNFDTIRSYGSAGDELENLPQYSREFVQNISKPNSLNHHHHHHHLHTPQINPLGTPRGSTLGSMVGSTLGSPVSTLAADTDSLHKPWKDALAHNLKDTYYENAKIQNGLYCTSWLCILG